MSGIERNQVGRHVCAENCKHDDAQFAGLAIDDVRIPDSKMANRKGIGDSVGCDLAAHHAGHPRAQAGRSRLVNVRRGDGRHEHRV